ncbi:MAG TPA: FAD-dependent oxidoreductase [Actinocrinis sp.]|nr:FAD-dependent oxidoreductase [Actinocrinis sp.]
MSTNTTKDGQRSAQRRIVVIGAGYAGLGAVLNAAKGGGGGGTQVTLIAPEDRFANRIRQHEVAAGHQVDGASLAQLAARRGFRFVQARVTELDLAGRKVFTDAGAAIGYDILVYALGSRTAFHGVPGAAELAFPMERAADLRDRIAGAARPGTVAVVGGGATGIELAAELAEAYPAWRVRIVAAGQVGGWFSARGRAAVARVFDRLKVSVYEQARVTAVAADGLRTTAGPIAADVVAWAASFEVPQLAAQSGLAVDDSGRILVDDRLRSVSHPEVYAVGDAAAVTVAGVPGPLRMACATASPMGAYVGKAIRAQARGAEEHKPYEFGFAVQCLSLGRKNGLLQPVERDDRMKERVFTGRAGKYAKLGILRYVKSSVS